MTIDCKKVKSGFPPIARNDSKVLILGSMPGEKSLTMNQYYAHKQNSFWKIIFSIYNETFAEEYKTKIHILKKNHLALWDVLKSCQRSGSLDSNIIADSTSVNDFYDFLSSHKKIIKICFNGQKAYQIFKRDVLKNSEGFFEQYEIIVLPSTSPAHASIHWTKKLTIWREHLLS